MFTEDSLDWLLHLKASWKVMSILREIKPVIVAHTCDPNSLGD